MLDRYQIIFWTYASNTELIYHVYKDMSGWLEIHYRGSAELNVFQLVQDWLNKTESALLCFPSQQVKHA